MDTTNGTIVTDTNITIVPIWHKLAQIWPKKISSISSVYQEPTILKLLFKSHSDISSLGVSKLQQTATEA